MPRISTRQWRQSPPELYSARKHAQHEFAASQARTESRSTAEDRQWHPNEHAFTSATPPLLAISTAIEFLEGVGLEAFRQRSHHLAKDIRQRLADFSNLPPIAPDDPQWYTSMAHAALPAGEAKPLQRALWQQHRIEVPIIDFGGRRWIRVSCHLYTQRAELERLMTALRTLLK